MFHCLVMNTWTFWSDYVLVKVPETNYPMCSFYRRFESRKTPRSPKSCHCIWKLSFSSNTLFVWSTSSRNLLLKYECLVENIIHCTCKTGVFASTQTSTLNPYYTLESSMEHLKKKCISCRANWIWVFVFRPMLLLKMSFSGWFLLNIETHISFAVGSGSHQADPLK